jgi:hypothetical protein
MEYKAEKAGRQEEADIIRRISPIAWRNLHHHDSDDPPRIARAAIPHCTRVYIFLKAAIGRTGRRVLHAVEELIASKNS